MKNAAVMPDGRVRVIGFRFACLFSNLAVSVRIRARHFGPLSINDGVGGKGNREDGKEKWQGGREGTDNASRGRQYESESGQVDMHGWFLVSETDDAAKRPASHHPDG